MNFGRQLQPVQVTITGGEKVDREYWVSRLKSSLIHQPCAVNHHPISPDKESFMIYPDANND